MLWLVLLMLEASSGGAQKPTSQAATGLVVGVPIERSLDGDEKHLFRFSAGSSGSWLIEAHQKGIDVKLVVSTQEGRSVVTGSHPIGRNGRESLVFEASAGDDLQIEVTPASRPAPPGQYRIEIVPLPDSPLARTRLEAERDMSRGACFSAEETGEGRQKAVTNYLRARDLWRELDMDRREAESIHAAAALAAYLGDSRTAVDRYREALGLWQTIGDRVMEATVLNDLGFNSRNMGDLDAATDFLEQAVAIHQEIGNRYGERTARSNLCTQLARRGDLEPALACYQEILVLSRELEEKRGEALTLNSIGGMHFKLGDPVPALKNIQQAYAIFLEIGDRYGQAQMLNSLAYMHRNFGESQVAIDYYRQSAAILEEIGNRRGLARSLNNIGFTYLSLGEPLRGRAYLQESLSLRRENRDKKGEGITLNNLGVAELALGDPTEALDFHRAALRPLRETGDRGTTANALTQMARANLALGNPEQALSDLEEAITIAEAMGDVRNTAEALLQKGHAELALGEPSLALTTARKATEHFESIGNQDGEAMALVIAARAKRRLGKPRKALANVNDALTIFESMRVEVDSPYLRATFLASIRDAYELAIDLLMTMDQAEPGSGFAAQALEVSERSRARSLLDLTETARKGSEDGVDPALLDQRRALRRRLHAKAGRQLRLLRRSPSAEFAEQLQREVQEALSDLEAIERAIRRQNPSAAKRASPITVAEIHRHLGTDTLLLEYSVGDKRSFLWVVDDSSVTTYELPGRDHIESLARQAHGLLSGEDAGDSDGEALLLELSRILLGPAASRLADQRLAIVADGALHYLPFAVLPNIGFPSSSTNDPLVLRHEIVYLPSVSILDAIRQQSRPDRNNGFSVAVLADPVFDRNDKRVSGLYPVGRNENEAESVLNRVSQRWRSNYLERLPATRLEAETIAKLLPEATVRQLLDFEASRSVFLDRTLHGYDVIHVATHGIFDSTNPELSAVVLSLVNERGLPQQGYLRRHDLHELDLDTDLVVLSGCQTALGRELSGEGLEGLTRGFLSAGASRVMASLWRIGDQETAELMERFYKELIVNDLTPTAALRRAQIAAIKTQEDLHWAAFLIQGEWSNLPLDNARKKQHDLRSHDQKSRWRARDN